MVPLSERILSAPPAVHVCLASQSNKMYMGLGGGSNKTKNIHTSNETHQRTTSRDNGIHSSSELSWLACGPGINNAPPANSASARDVPRPQSCPPIKQRTLLQRYQAKCLSIMEIERRTLAVRACVACRKQKRKCTERFPNVFSALKMDGLANTLSVAVRRLVPTSARVSLLEARTRL
jgi:hypothetical protein